MSTGADCQIVERKPGEFTLRVQRYPYGETEEYDERGPFSSQEAAEKYLDKHFANPGAVSFVSYATIAAREARRAQSEEERDHANAQSEGSRGR